MPIERDEKMNVEELKKKYKKEWLALKILKEDKAGNILDCELIAHKRERRKLHEELRERRERCLHHLCWRGRTRLRRYNL